MWLQREITLEPRPRGFHLVTREVEGALPELSELEVGLCHLHILHTSASLTLNENASPDVRRDFETWFGVVVPEDFGGWTHTLEGPDDMPAHIKASLLGPSLSLPVARGRADTTRSSAMSRKSRPTPSSAIQPGGSVPSATAAR
jgi:secondary thiamine-phosphate synthase enzyme